nr:MAG TPA: hypothetical protein [Caudoviricetes sp.]
MIICIIVSISIKYVITNTPLYLFIRKHTLLFNSMFYG